MFLAVSRLTHAFGLMFVYCDMGEQVTAEFGKIDDAIYQMDWHLFPIKTQRMILFIFMVAQQPVKFNGFGNFPATRETMKKVTQFEMLRIFDTN